MTEATVKFCCPMYLSAAAALIIALPQAVSATLDTGKPAPTFSDTDSAGKPVSLADCKGKTVVLEWTNHDCPYVRKHYSVGNIRDIQRKAAPTGIVLDPEGKIGNMSPTRDTGSRSIHIN